MAKTSVLKTGFVILNFLVATSAVAGVAFAPPLKGPDLDNDDYPESRFGAGPMTETSHGYAARQVYDMETPDEESGRAPTTATRGIASVNEPAIITTQSAASQDIPQSLVARRGVQEVSVIASDLGYFPKTVFVSRDVPVRMFVTGASKNTLCIMMDSFQVRKQVRSQKIEEITFVPNVPGKYRFYCPVNGMEGTLVVKEFSSFAQQDDSCAPASAPAQPQAQAPRTPASSERSVPQVAAGWQSAVEN